MEIALSIVIADEFLISVMTKPISYYFRGLITIL